MRGCAERGFSLLELMVSMALLAVVAAGGFLVLNQSQKVSVSSSELSTEYASVRNAAELIAQEVGQAGAICGSTAEANPPCSAAGANAMTLSATVTGGTSTTATLSCGGNSNCTQGLYVGEKLTIDPNQMAEEIVQIGAISGNTITLTSTPSQQQFGSNHSAGALVLARGVGWQGVIDPAAGTTYSNTLKLWGDINGDGNLYYVEYNCDFTANQLTRSITPISNSTKNAADVLIDNLIFIAPSGYTGSSYCFVMNGPTAIVKGSTTYYFATQAGLLISVQSPYPDPQTKQPLQLTKSFLNLSPRNVVAAYDLAGNNVWGPLQPTPNPLPQ